MRTRSTLTIAAVAGLLLGTAANGWEVPGMKDLDKTLNGAKSATVPRATKSSTSEPFSGLVVRGRINPCAIL